MRNPVDPDDHFPEIMLGMAIAVLVWVACAIGGVAAIGYLLYSVWEWL